MPGIVTRNARSTANAIEDQLEARDLQGLGLFAVAGATGVILAQEVTERVLPILSMPAQPSTVTQFAAAGGIKLAFALVVGAVGASMGGLPLVFLAFHAVGAVVFAGADFVNAIQRTGLVAEGSQHGARRRGTGNPRAASRSRSSAGQQSGGASSSSSSGGSLFDAA